MIPDFTIAPDSHTLVGFEIFFRYMMLNDSFFQRVFDECEKMGMSESNCIKVLLMVFAHDRARLQDEISERFISDNFIPFKSM
jgi:hypothetical protein